MQQDTRDNGDRVAELLAGMSLEEKLAQLVGVWVDAGSGAGVAPMQDAMLDETPPFEEFAKDGIGQITRFYGTAPVDPVSAARVLRERQRWLVEQTRTGIPAVVHEECLTGLAAWQATTFPAPLSWGATFDPELVRTMGRSIGETMRSLGVHQGLAPVLDVVRDARWGRVEECISEDPYVVGTVGTSYVRGLQDAGIVATLKHFVGYSASRAGRNLAPVHAGPRELADVLLPPFEMAVLDGGARSVMHSYAEIDGLPAAADRSLLTDLLRERWGFDGVVVADYFGIAFLATLHGVAADLADAAHQGLAAGVDVELPTGNAYRGPLTGAVRSGVVDEALVDRAVERVLRQKAELGLLDERFEPGTGVDPGSLDPAEHRALARRLAEEAVVLVANDGTLPLAAEQSARIAVIGPNADRETALFGCYSFANHVLDHHPDVALGIDVPTVLAALRTELPGAEVSFARGCAVADLDRAGIEPAVAAARAADVAVVVVGDQAGLFGRGTSGEGCDADSLELPGVQRELVEAVVATGTPVVLVMLTGRPYAVEWALESCAAVVQAFFPGEEGASAIAGVLSGRVNPSGRLPVSLPRSAGSQPYSYLHPPLGGPSSVSNLDPEPVRPFGFGLSYTTFTHEELAVATSVVATAGRIEASVLVTNSGDRRGADVVQLYAHDPVASVTRPVAQLLGYARVELDPGESRVVRFSVPTTRLAFSGRDLVRAVEPGAVDLWVGPSCAVRETESAVELVGLRHPVTTADARWVDVVVEPA
ncbi:beta-xylosidase/alpha-l-arabinosidase [Cellulomonas hominis]